MTLINTNTYGRILKEQGINVINVDDVDWFEYSGFMMPAYLPHCVPDISVETAANVLQKSGKPFVRWDKEFGMQTESEWWYILKKGHWDIASVKDKKKRWMIRQGKKTFKVRPLDFQEVTKLCPGTAKQATARYKGDNEIETQEVLEKRVAAGLKTPGVLEYLGCFYENRLVSFSENYIQENAVWLAIIRHDPEFLNMYSSYGFMDGILDYYLNTRNMSFVLDGCRSIHHKTNFQEHLIKVFEFTKEYAKLNVLYSLGFEKIVMCAYPFRKFIWNSSNTLNNGFLDNVGAVLKQEYIRRSCK